MSTLRKNILKQNMSRSSSRIENWYQLMGFTNKNNRSGYAGITIVIYLTSVGSDAFVVHKNGSI